MNFDDHPDWDEVDHLIAGVEQMVHSSASEALVAFVRLADGLPDDRLCSLGVRIIEPLVDMHWNEIGDALEAAARSHANVRKALSCTSADDDEVNDRLHALV